MKNTVIISIFALLAVSCGNRKQSNAESAERRASNVIEMNASRAILDRDTIELGTLKAGEVVEYELGVKNTDASPMVILDVTATCGCTALDFDRSPVAPGNTGYLTIQYDSKGQSGSQMKLVRLITSFDSRPHHILIHANVEP